MRGWSAARAFWPRAAARDRGWTRRRTSAVNRTIAVAAEAAPNSGWSRSARCSTRLAKTDMGEPSGGLVVPDGVPGRRGGTPREEGRHDDTTPHRAGRRDAHGTRAAEHERGTRNAEEREGRRKALRGGGRREGGSGSPWPGAAPGVGVALRQEGGTQVPVPHRRTHPRGRHDGHAARGHQRADGERRPGRGGRGERDTGGQPADGVGRDEEQREGHEDEEDGEETAPGGARSHSPTRDHRRHHPPWFVTGHGPVPCRLAPSHRLVSLYRTGCGRAQGPVNAVGRAGADRSLTSVTRRQYGVPHAPRHA